MKAAKYALLSAAILMAFSGSMLAQPVISAKAGMINDIDGKVLLDGKAVEMKTGVFPQLKANQELTTEDSRAEVLLAPGTFLRVGENSRVKMVNDSLVDTQLELMAGSIVVEIGAMEKADRVTLTTKSAKIVLEKSGLYRIDADPGQIRVFDGEARVEQSSGSVPVKKAKLLALNGISLPERFDAKTTDALLRWAKRRAEYIAMANPSSARGMRNSLTGNSWIWNQYFGMYTFVPYRGTYRSFWGYNYWSPRTVYMVYNPPAIGQGGYSPSGFDAGSGRGYSGVSATSYGTSGVAASSPAPTASSSSPVSSGSSVGRESGSAGGGRR